MRSASQTDYCTLQQRKRSTPALCLHSAVYLKHNTCRRQWTSYRLVNLQMCTYFTVWRTAIPEKLQECTEKDSPIDTCQPNKHSQPYIRDWVKPKQSALQDQMQAALERYETRTWGTIFSTISIMHQRQAHVLQQVFFM